MGATPGVGLTQVVKHRRHGRAVRVEARRVLGELPPCPYPAHVERLNGGLRDRLGRLTGKTHAFARQASTWDAAVTPCLFEHSWLRPHWALRGAGVSAPGRRALPAAQSGHGHSLD